MENLVLLFGEAEKGQFCRPIACRSLPELLEVFGNPPAESQGLFYAIQTLLFERQLVYYRVEEEGFSLADYKRGIAMLRMRELKVSPSAIYMPGVGNAHLINEMSEICFLFHSLLITTERDFYDYLTN